MSEQKILVIEDEGDIQELISLFLKKAGYQVECASLGSMGLALLNQKKFNLILLDWMLPDQSGIEVIHFIRKHSQYKEIPIVLLTAKTESRDIVRGLEAGADDYITKPFEMEVLKARIKTVLRRNYSSILQDKKKIPQKIIDETEILKIKDIEINIAAYEVQCSGKTIELTRSEFKLLVALVQNQGRVLTRTQLIDEVQGKGISVVDRAVDTHIFGLRKKLGACAQIVETIRGVGYRIHA